MKNLFLFTGEETYLLSDQINSWKQAYKERHGDTNLEVMDASETPLNDIMAATIAMPFLGEKRLIFIHGLPDTPKTRNPDEVTKKDEKRDEDLKKLEKHLDDIPETSVVVFVQPNPDRRKSFYKKLAGKAEVKEFAPLQGQALTSWIKSEVEKKGASVDESTAEYLVSLTGPNLWKVAQEISKLTSHSPGIPITKSLIDNLIIPTLEANVFHLTDALGAKDHRKAIHNLHRSMAAGENLRQVFYMIVRQFRLLLQGSGYMISNPKGNPTSFAATLKLHPFVARNTLDQLKRFNRDELQDAYTRLLEIDTALKTSGIRITIDNQDELALAIERFILRFCCK
jgi:DNA polymerase-3 subunit delta